MEGDKIADNEKELTSTSSSDMDKLLSTNKEEKNESNDTLPTSSTDASTSVKSTHLVSDDPISSTSSEMDSTKLKPAEKTSVDRSSTFETDVELLGMSMTSQSTERIEENVDDLVSDLETLLGNSTEAFHLPFKTAEVPEKTEVSSALEEDSNALNTKLENEVSSNTDSTPTDKTVSFAEVAVLESHKTEGDSSQNETTSKVEETAKAIDGSEGFESNTCVEDVGSENLESSKGDNGIEDSESSKGAVKDRIEEPEEIVVPTEPVSDNTQKNQAVIDLSEKEKVDKTKESSKINPITDLTLDSNKSVEISLEIENATEGVDAANVKCDQYITKVYYTEKSDEVSSRESSGDHKSDADEPKTISQKSKEALNQLCDKIISIKSEESSIESPLKETEMGLVEELSTEPNQSKDTTDNILKEVKVPSEEISEVVTDLEKPSIENVGRQHIPEHHQSSKIISAEAVDSGATLSHNEEKPETEKSKEDTEDLKEDTEDLLKEKDQGEKLNCSLHVPQCDEEQKIQCLDKKDVNPVKSAQDFDIVKKTIEGVAEVNESSASTEGSVETFKENTDIVAVIEDHVPKAEDKQIEETTGMDDKIEMKDTEDCLKKSLGSQDLNNISESIANSNIEQENLENIAQESISGLDVKKENKNQNIDVSKNMDMAEIIVDIQETKDPESAEITIEHKIKIDDSVKRSESQLEVSDELSDKEMEKKSESSDESIADCNNQNMNCSFEETQAQTPTDLSESKEKGKNESYCESVISDVSCQKIVESVVEESDPEASSKDSEIPTFVAESAQDTDKQCQNTSKSQSNEIEISELANTPSPTDKAAIIVFKPVVEEPEENASLSSETVSKQPQDTEIIEVSEQENQSSVNIENLKENQAEIIHPEIIGSETSVKTNDGEVEYKNIPGKSDEIIKNIEIKDVEPTSILAEEHLESGVQKDDTSAIVKETNELIVVSDMSRELGNVIKIQESTPKGNKVDEGEESCIAVPEGKAVEEPISPKLLIKIDSNNKESATVNLEDKMDFRQEEAIKEILNRDKKETLVVGDSTELIDGKETLVVGDSTEVINESPNKATDQQDLEQNKVALNITSKKNRAEDLPTDLDVKKMGVNQNDIDVLKATPYSEQKEVIEDTNDNRKKTIDGKTPDVDARGLQNLITASLSAQEQTSSREDIAFIPTDSDHVKKGKSKLEVFAKHVQDIKPTPEINIRRKTVEQDLEKVVCLSEESSDSDSSEEAINNLSKPEEKNESDFEPDSFIHDVPLTDDLPNQEESNLIEIARKVEQLQNVGTNEPVESEITSEESMPGIENILTDHRSEIPLDSEENLETILAVASLQNEPVHELKVERRLSEKELREMEAIRMAVASITDSSQDTYDSYLVESSMTMDNNSIPEVSSDMQEFSNDIQEPSDNTQNFAESMVQENTVVPDDDFEKNTKIDIEKDSNSKDVMNKEANKSDLDQVSSLKASPNPADPNHEPTFTSKDIEQIQVPNKTKDSLDIDESRDLTYFDDVSKQSEVLVPKRSIMEGTLSIPEKIKESEDLLPQQVQHVQLNEVSVSEQVVKGNKHSELQNLNKIVLLECDDIAKESKITAPEQLIKEKVELIAEKESPISKNDADEKKDTIPESVIEQKEISKYDPKTDSDEIKDTTPEPVIYQKEIPKSEMVKELETTSRPLHEKKKLSAGSYEEERLPASQVVQEKEVTHPASVPEETKIFSSKQAIKEQEILTPKQVVEEEQVLASEDNEVLAPQQVVEERTLRNRTRRGNKVSEPLSISVEDVERKEKPYSPKITIKPVKVPDEEVSTTSDAEGNKGSLKITITKQSDKMHSILKVYNPDDDSESLANQEEPIPKLIIKPKMQQVEQQHSPKMSTRSSKVYSPNSTRCSSPRVTIKPVIKPAESKIEAVSPLKITFKPVVKPDESGKKHSPKTFKELEQKNHSPKIIIKPIPKPAESEREETIVSTPKVTIKPIKRHIDDNEGENEQERSSPKIIIKPLVKPTEQDGEHANQTMPKLKIKPIKKYEDEENAVMEKDRESPKVSIKPIVKPVELEEEDEEIKERIVLKINKGNLPTPSKDSRKREYPEDEKTEKMGKLKLKFSTTGGQTHIVQEVEDGCKRQRKDSGYSGKKDVEEVSNKRTSEDKLTEKNKRLRSSITPDKLGEDDINIHGHKLDSPIVISEDSRSQHSADCLIVDDSQSNSSDISKIADIALRTTHIEASPVVTVGVVTPSVSPAPKKRGRPRKVPLEIREELKDPLATPQLTPQSTPQTTPVAETSSTLSGSSMPGTPVTTPSPGGRPKRSCRGQNVIATLGIKPRKPRGRGSGRGGKVNMGDREPVQQAPEEPVQTVSIKPEKEPKLTKAKLKLIQKAAEEEAKRQKEDVNKQALEAEKARQNKEEKVKQEEQLTLKQQEEELEKRNLESQKVKEEEERLEKQKEVEEEKRRELAEQKVLEEEEKHRVVEDTKRKLLEAEKEKKQEAFEEARRAEIEKQSAKEIEENTQKELDKTRREEIEQHNILEAEETARIQKEDTLKRKKEEGEGQTPPKKKKDDKTPPRKLEITTRRQKAQLQKAAEEAEKAAVEAQKVVTEVKNPVGSPKKVVEPTVSGNTSSSDPAILLSDEHSLEDKETEKKPEAKKDQLKEKGKKTPEQKGKGKTTPEKAKKLLEKAAKLEEEKKAEEDRKAEEQARANEQKKAEEQNKAEQERNAEKEIQAAEEKITLEKQALEQKKVEELRRVQEEVKAEVKTEEKPADDKKPEEAAGDKKCEEASAEGEEESEDSEDEKQRKRIKQIKQEAIIKCRAKRMEKRAKAAELKRKRQEQAAQQRAARIAAEEAERVAAEKSKINRRYGRYGNPKPQISLIDAPVSETEGTIKSHLGLFNPQTDHIMITQPTAVHFDSAEKVTLTPISSSHQKLLAPPTPEPMAVDSTEDTPTKRRPIGSEDVMMVDEETRMSADFRGSRAQTPAKQSIPPPETMIEDSQGSIGTESVGGKSKSSKTPKMEVFQDLESIQVSAEQVAEYSWNGRGPFMIQEQVALFLGIKSFKRKYPNCQRRTVDMQERDYLKENGYVTEAQCDLGLTAVNAQDILDIMYTDFQDKYEDYCKVQREKQARELANKQKALSQFTFKPGYEKLDIIEQAVQSAAAWNQQFNKSRREERKAHMDLQNLTVHYPKSKMKAIPTTKVGDHPIALVPGQFTDYYKEFTPTELNNLPLNTMCYDEIKVHGMESDSDESSSESDSDSNSDSSSSDSSCNEDDCKECDKRGNVEVNEGNDVTTDNNGSNDSVVLVSVTAAAPVSA